MTARFDSDEQALGELLAAGGKGDWDLCAESLTFLLRDRLDGAALETYVPASTEEAQGLMLVLGEACLDQAPEGSAVRTLHDSVAGHLAVDEDVDDAFQAIMDL